MDVWATEEQAQVAEAVGGIASKFGHRYFVERARAGEPPSELWDAIAEGGFAGVNIPAEYGGGGMGIAELSVVIETLASQGCPLLTLVVSPAICGSILTRHGSDAQRDAWLPGLATGQRKLAFAITEPDAGSNSHRISLAAKRVEGGWRLNGTKYYITGVDEADAILVVARTSVDERSGRGRLSLFIVPTDAEGLGRAAIPVELVAPEKQFTLSFDDVFVPDEALVGPEDEGLRVVFDGLNPERITAAAISNGIGRYALDKAAGYARERVVWDVPIGSHQGIAHPLAEAYIQLQQARLVMMHAAARYDAGREAGEAANIAKFAAAEASLHALDRAIQTHGGNGLSSEYGLADLWFVARLLRTAPVSREMILNFVAQHSLGLPRSY